MNIRKIALAAFAVLLVGFAGASLTPKAAEARHGWNHGPAYNYGQGQRWRANRRWQRRQNRRWQRRQNRRWRRAPVVQYNQNHHYHGARHGIRPFRPIRRILRGLHHLVHPWNHGGYR